MFLSCGSIVPISAVNNKVDIGMTKTEFLAVALDRAKKDAMTETYYVYRIDQYNLDGNVIDSMFYYFRNSDDKLFEVNAGTKATDVNLNINN
tara:strand:+ start:104 stop:379 length:276 start_codon:yes stop_codon:yes gene_type:complete